MDITKAQFADFNNTAGKTTFSYAELLAQLLADLGSVGQIGIGAAVNQGAAGQSIPNAVATPVDFTAGGGATVHYDDAGFFVSPDSFVIPLLDPPIQRVIVAIGVFWFSGAGTFRRLRTEFNGAGPTTNNLMQQNDVVPVAAIQTAMAVECLPIPVVAGDTFTFGVTHNDGGALFINETAASILVVQ